MPLLPSTSSESTELTRRGDDWHSVLILGARASIIFVFLVPILAMVGEFANRMLLHSQVPVIDNLGAILWICAGGMVTLMTVAAKLGGKHDADRDRILLDASHLSAEPSVHQIEDSHGG